MFDKFTLIYGWMKKRSVFDLIDAFTTAFCMSLCFVYYVT